MVTQMILQPCVGSLCPAPLVESTEATAAFHCGLLRRRCLSIQIVALLALLLSCEIVVVVGMEQVVANDGVSGSCSDPVSVSNLSKHYKVCNVKNSKNKTKS